ncbi:MarR family winged helix-turn-helix transcriptional regulator [Acidisphaera rubrifaciens]|uniref:Transcriptional regulator MarR n=1 Tax=Acidisphaera rubrifaciens HS-AP3 TaxID=1231350 RepID=A0A0D6P711_9PROT|nr:MarR family transcriptional regulator [Acidisphaera rubrifaciens]GAN77565.1 transcriptional regulator MarR [Acidisphaera rubrifaciens HS-AP3]
MAATPRPSDPHAHLGYWLRTVSNAVSHAFARKLDGAGVTVAEWVVLRTLHDLDPVGPSELAARMGMTKGAISKLADRLVGKELLVRAADPGDRRAHRLALTPAGRALVPRLADIAETCLRLQGLLDQPSLRAMLLPRMLTLGASTVGAFLRRQAAFSLDGLAGRIRCPTLVVDCEGDFASQSERLFAALRCEKTLVALDAASGAGGHCGGLGQQVWAGAVFPWIAHTVGWRD